jgi:hypothetical protein
MPTIDPVSWATKWSTAMSNAGSAYKSGIQNTRVNPMQAAIANLDKAKRNYNQAIDSGKTAAGLARVSMATWQQNAMTKGANRLTDGAVAAKPKVLAFAQLAAPIVSALSDEVRQMPNNNKSDAMAIMSVVYDRMKQLAAQRASSGG